MSILETSENRFRVLYSMVGFSSRRRSPGRSGQEVRYHDGTTAMIPFNRPCQTGREASHLAAALAVGKLSGDGAYTARCSSWLEKHFSSPKVLLTTSCTAALEMAALLAEISPADEVILPSFTFVSTANAFVLRGARIIFVDIDPLTMNIDPACVAEAITPKTKAIIPVHYAGVACEMDALSSLAQTHRLLIIEDAAQAVMGYKNGQALGTFGTFGCYSFHETKNYVMGEGGALLVNDPAFVERAEIIREKGTNRSRFFRGQVDKYTWVDAGSSYLPSELNAAYLWPQLEDADIINTARLQIWNSYYSALAPLAASGRVQLPHIPKGCAHNAHMFWLKLRDLADRTAFSEHMKQQGIATPFHYVPLHSSPAGQRYGEFRGEDRHTTTGSNRLVRLPLWYGMTEEQTCQVIDAAIAYLRN